MVVVSALILVVCAVIFDLRPRFSGISRQGIWVYGLLLAMGLAIMLAEGMDVQLDLSRLIFAK